MFKLFFLICFLFLSNLAMAGSWRYGCIGVLPDASLVNFNRATLAIVSTIQPPLYEANVDISKDIQVADSLNINSGLQREMEFKKITGDIIKLIETRTRRVSHREKNEACSANRSRTITDDRMKKTYKLVRPGETTVIGVLKCYDINISTCG